jgi:hypothetical protein
MDFELPFLSRIRANQVPELSAREALQHMARASHRGRWPRKVKVAGRIKGPLRSETPDETTFALEDEGTQLTVRLPRTEAEGLAPGQRVIMEGRLLLTAMNSSLAPVLKGHIVSGGQLRREILQLRNLSRLSLADFFQFPASGLVILGSERALRDVDDELKKEDCYPGPVRREIVRMTERAEVLAAAHRYAGVAQAILFVRRGGEGHEFKFWSDPVFIEDLLEAGLHIYLGLGHADDQTALDSLADETFPTASAAGVALARALRAPRRAPESMEPSEPAPVMKDSALSRPVVKDTALPKPELKDAALPKPEVKEELYLSNTMIWIIALTLGAIVLIVGLR